MSNVTLKKTSKRLLPTSPPEKKTYDTPFEVHDNTPIGFGKLKGKPHSILQNPEWKSYCGWMMNQSNNPDWRFTSTTDYIDQNVSL
jgi:hypothetical protein